MQNSKEFISFCNWVTSIIKCIQEECKGKIFIDNISDPAKIEIKRIKNILVSVDEFLNVVIYNIQTENVENVEMIITKLREEEAGKIVDTDFRIFRSHYFLSHLIRSNLHFDYVFLLTLEKEYVDNMNSVLIDFERYFKEKELRLIEEKNVLKMDPLITDY